MENTFKEIDKEKVVEFLNFVAKKATFSDMSVTEVIEFFKLLSHMQHQIIPKIESHILEIKKVHEAPKAEPVEEKPKGRGRKSK